MLEEQARQQAQAHGNAVPLPETDRGTTIALDPPPDRELVLDAEPIEAIEAPELSEEIPYGAAARVSVRIPVADEVPDQVNERWTDAEPSDAVGTSIEPRDDTTEITIVPEEPELDVLEPAPQATVIAPAVARVAVPVRAEIPVPSRAPDTAAVIAASPTMVPAPEREPTAPSRSMTVQQAREWVSRFADEMAHVVSGDDDLQQIKGIGPKTSQNLHELGITTFRHLALFPESEVEVMAKAIRYSSSKIRRGEWRSQARRLHQLKTGEQLA